MLGIFKNILLGLRQFFGNGDSHPIVEHIAKENNYAKCLYVLYFRMGPEIIVPRQISNQTDEVEHDNSKNKRREPAYYFFHADRV